MLIRRPIVKISNATKAEITMEDKSQKITVKKPIEADAYEDPHAIFNFLVFSEIKLYGKILIYFLFLLFLLFLLN